MSLLCVAGLFASMSSCYYDNPVIEIENVSFNDDVIPIFETSCLGAGCHQVGGPPPVLTADRAYDALINGSTPTGTPYVIVATPNESSLMMELDNGEMPPAGSLPQLNIEQVRKWMSDGAKDN
jgi:hypothetical protein